MTEAAATGSGQGSGQSSSSSAGQQSSQGSGAQSGASQGQQTSQNSGQQAGQQQPAAPQRPAYVPETFWDATKNEVVADKFTAHLNDLSAFKAEQDVRKQSLPASPDKYEVKLPEGFKPPEGMQFEFDMDDPALKSFRDAAHKRGFDQETFSEALGIYAGNKIQELAATNAARTAELAKLGAAAPARIEAVETWFKAKVGGKAGPMMAALKAYPVAETVEALEGVIRAFSSQGGTDFNQSGREGQPTAGKIEGYDGMSFTQKRMAQMDQNSKAAKGGR